ncbi:MAG: alpha/beta hydrolase, partial [Alsobacter sp.]
MSDLQDIAAIRTLLSSQPRPVGWAERRRRIEEVGAAVPAAADIACAPASAGGLPAEWSPAPG